MRYLIIKGELGMLFRFPLILLSLTFVVLLGCDNKSLNLDYKTSSTLSGKIDLNSSSSQKAGSIKLCSSYTVSIYSIDEDGVQSSEPVDTVEAESDGSFTFTDLKENGIENRNQKLLDSYILEASGCSETYSRAATGVNGQDISVGSTFMSFLLGTDIKGSFANVVKEHPELLESLISSIEGAANFQQAYGLIDGDDSLKQKFSEVFNGEHTLLQAAAPRIQSVLVQKNIPESNATIFSVTADHWKSDYSEAFQWKWDDVVVGNSATYSKTPGKNEQGEHVLKLLVGKDNGGGLVDLTKPYHQREFKVNVANTFKPVVPAFSLVSASLTNNSSITVQMATGAGQVNCETFSTLAISENSAEKPEESEFVYSCSSAGTQNIAYGLDSVVNGLKVLRLWARDASGNISVTPQSVSLTFDNIAPVVSFSSPAVNSRHQSTLTMAGSCEANGTVNVSGDASSPASFSCSSGSFSETFTLTAGEGSKTITLTQTDGAGNSGSVSRVVERDNTAPALTVVSPADSSDHQTAVTIAGACENGLVVNFNGAGVSGGSDSVSCSAGTYSKAVSMSAGEGVKAITVNQTDEAGNATSIAKSYDRDNTAPVITQTTISVDGSDTFKSNADSVIWGGACEDGSSIAVTGTDTQSVTCSSNTWSYDVVDKTSDGTYSYTFTHEDEAGNSTAVTVHWVRNTTKPVLSFMQINDGAASTTSNYLQVDATASDSYDNITHFCFKYNDSSEPVLGASCWVPVNNPSPGLSPSQNISFTDFSFPTGLAVGSYTVSVWMKDELGNISSNGSVDGTDEASVIYSPGTPPEAQGVLAASVDSPSNPLTSGDTAIAVSNDVYIKWKIYDAEALHATPVDLYYTTDDTNYSLIASNLSDGANGGCTPDDGVATIDDSYTGCYLWSGGAPTNNYFSIRLVVRDDSNATTIANSNPINSAEIRVLAGNTSSAVGVPASNAILFNEFNKTQPDVNSFVVDNGGNIYFKDNVRGILKISNSTGLVDVFIPKNTGSSGTVGDGGSIASAQVKDPVKINLSYDNKLLIFDYNRIRAVDLNVDPPTIDTVIGGGGLKTDNVDPLDLDITLLSSAASGAMSFPFLPLPNGDIIFQSENYEYVAPEDGHLLRYYDASLDKVLQKNISGTGTGYDNAQDISLCKIIGEAFSYDLTNSNINYGLVQVNHRMDDANCSHPSSNSQVDFARLDSNFQSQSVINPPSSGSGHRAWQKMVTGRDGSIYSVKRDDPNVAKYDPISNTWSVVYGNGSAGECDDGTPATSCASMVSDIFVTDSGQIYVFDGRRIRLVDSSGNVVTIAGQGYSYGDGYQPLVARFGGLDYVQKTDAGEIVVLDYQSYRIRSFTDSGTVQTVAGNGKNQDGDTVTAANISPFFVNDHAYSTGFFVNKSNGDIYTSFKDAALGKLNRSTGLWEQIVGGGATRYEVGDGLTGSNIYLDGYAARVFGMGNDEIILGLDSWSTFGPVRSLMKIYDLTTTVQSNFLGQTGTPSWSDDEYLNDWPDGTALNGEYLYPPKQLESTSMTEVQYDSFEDYWLTANRNRPNIRIIDRNSNQVQTLTSVANGNIKSFVRVRDAGLTINLVYYCSSDGKIYKRDLNGVTDTQLNWPISSISCDGSSMVYDSVKDSLIFIFKQNGLYGVAEYEL